MSTLVTASFPADLTTEGWTATQGTGDTLAYTSSGLNGTVGGATMTLGANAAVSHVSKSFTAVTATDFRMRFYVADLSTLTMTSGDTVEIGQIYRTSGTSLKGRLELNDAAGTKQIRMGMRNDAGSTLYTAYSALSNLTNYIEVYIKKASTDATADGEVHLLFDNSEQVGSIANVLVYTHFDFDQVRVGGCTSPTTTTGTFLFDEIKVTDEAAVIGAASAAPVNRVPANKDFDYGSLVATTGVSVTDADDDLDTVALSCDNGMVMNVTLSGGATITPGANGTNALTIATATAAEFNTVLGTLTCTLLRPALSTWTTTSTITMTSTDDLAATDVDTFDVVWTPASGVGGTSVIITGTAAQILACIATMELTSNVLGTYNGYMSSTTSGGGSDADSFAIEVGSFARSSESMRTPDIRRSKRLTADRRLGPTQRRHV